MRSHGRAFVAVVAALAVFVVGATCTQAGCLLPVPPTGGAVAPPKACCRGDAKHTTPAGVSVPAQRQRLGSQRWAPDSDYDYMMLHPQLGAVIGGCSLMFFHVHPLLAYAVVGFGAAAYSPAKYGILTELLPAEKLVAANGWIAVCRPSATG